jgi:hypothetical protein
MDNVIPFAPAAGTFSASGPGLYSDHMLAELLALQEVIPATAAKPATRRPLIATQPASGAANHARHHVSRRTQS